MTIKVLFLSNSLTKFSLFDKIDMKYESQRLKIEPSTTFQINPIKNRKIGQKLEFDPKTNNDIITRKLW